MRFAESAGTVRQAGGRDLSRMYLAAKGECKTFTVPHGNSLVFSTL